jgi:hypothetical protein
MNRPKNSTHEGSIRYWFEDVKLMAAFECDSQRPKEQRFLLTD